MLKYLITVLLLATVASADTIASGLDIGERLPAHHPNHVTGPDAGTDACPV